MSTSGNTARAAAAAFAIGISLGAPLVCSMPVANADSPDTSVSSGSDSARAQRGPRTGPRTEASTGSRGSVRAAAATAARRVADAAPSALETSPETAHPRSARSTPATTAAATEASAPVTRVTAPVASVARALFGANKAPAVNPVQLTGQTEGPITGTMGAEDPGRGRLTYAVTVDPRYGVVAVTPDGSYTYTPGTDFAGSDSFAVTVTKFRNSMMNPKRAKTTEVTVAVSQGALTSLLKFQFVYGAGSQYWTPEARSSLDTAAKLLAQYFTVSSPVTITYSVTGEKKPLSGTLASAGSDFIDSGDGFLQTVVQAKIQTGIDSNGASPDGEITWNFGPNWGYGNSVGNTDYDFESTAMHELTHTLGFLSYVYRPGNNGGKTWTVYDRYLVNADGVAAISGDYSWKDSFNPNLTGGNGGLFFGGPNAEAAYNGPVPLYTPSPWSSGSSVSHLDDPVFSGSNEKLMNAVSGSGYGVRRLSPVELGILADIGYQVTPGTSTLMFVGLVGLRRLRRKN